MNIYVAAVLGSGSVMLVVTLLRVLWIRPRPRACDVGRVAVHADRAGKSCPRLKDGTCPLVQRELSGPDARRVLLCFRLEQWPLKDTEKAVVAEDFRG